jgi:hypothetical protein
MIIYAKYESREKQQNAHIIEGKKDRLRVEISFKYLPVDTLSLVTRVIRIVLECSDR